MTETIERDDLLANTRELAGKRKPTELSLKDLKRYVLIKYGSEARFSRSMGWGRALGPRMLNGSWIPQKPDIIARIAEQLGIDPIILTQLFERLRNRPHFVTADKLLENSSL